jgi:hypothetical protein
MQCSAVKLHGRDAKRLECPPSLAYVQAHHQRHSGCFQPLLLPPLADQALAKAVAACKHYLLLACLGTGWGLYCLLVSSWRRLVVPGFTKKGELVRWRQAVAAPP